jgi:hypothetical protein
MVFRIAGTHFPRFRLQFPNMGTHSPNAGTHFLYPGTHFPRFRLQFPDAGTQFLNAGTQLLYPGLELPNPLPRVWDKKIQIIDKKWAEIVSKTDFDGCVKESCRPPGQVESRRTG